MLEDSQVFHDGFFLFGLCNTEPKYFLQTVFVVHKQHPVSWKGIAINHEIARSFVVFIDAIERIFVQTSLYIETDEVLCFLGLIGYLSHGVPFENILPKPIVRSEFLLIRLSLSFDETVVAIVALELRATAVSFPVLL